MGLLVLFRRPKQIDVYDPSPCAELGSLPLSQDSYSAIKAWLRPAREYTSATAVRQLV